MGAVLAWWLAGAPANQVIMDSILLGEKQI